MCEYIKLGEAQARGDFKIYCTKCGCGYETIYYTNCPRCGNKQLNESTNNE